MKPKTQSQSKFHNSRSNLLVLPAVLVLSMAGFQQAQATDGSWVSATAGGNWTTNANWSASPNPTTGQTATLGDATANRTVFYDTATTVGSTITATTGSLGTLNITQTSSFSNILEIQKSLTLTNAITLGATTGGTAKITIGSTASAGMTLSPPATGGLTINPGGEVSMTCTGNGTTSYWAGRIGTATSTTTIAGGTLRLALPTGTSTGTSATNTMDGALTMTSGTISVENTGTCYDRRLQVTGNVNITGTATVSATAIRTGADGTATLKGSTNVLNPTTWSSNWALTLGATGDQTLSLNFAIPPSSTIRGTGVKTVTSSKGSGNLNALSFVDESATASTTLKLGSNLTMISGGLLSLAAGGQVVDTNGRIDAGIDTNGFTLDLSIGTWTPTATTQAAPVVTTSAWNFSDSAGTGKIKATAFVFSTAKVTTNVGAGVTLLASGGNSTASDLGDNTTSPGTIDATSTFKYSGAALAATPATLTSNRAIGNLEVTSGVLRFSGTGAAGATTISGGTLDISTFSDTVGAVTLASGSITGTTGTLTSTGSYDVQSGSVSAILAGSVALTKTTSGTVTLTGVNAYTGTTTINAGTLALGAAGSIATSSGVVIAAGAKLDTTAKTTYTLPSTLTLGVDASGTSGQIDATGKVLDISSASVSLNVTGTLTGSSYVLATYASKTGAAFAAVTGVPSGYAVTYTATQALLSQSSSPFSTWISTNYPSLTGADALAGANPDSDGLTNLQEFAFGTDPTVSSSGSIAYVAGGAVTTPGSPVAVNVAVGGGVDYRAVFGRRKSYAADGLTYTVQFSVDFSSWTNSSATPTVLTGSDIANPGPIEAVSVPYPLLISYTRGGIPGYEKPTFFRVAVSSSN